MVNSTKVVHAKRKEVQFNSLHDAFFGYVRDFKNSMPFSIFRVLTYVCVLMFIILLVFIVSRAFLTPYQEPVLKVLSMTHLLSMIQQREHDLARLTP